MVRHIVRRRTLAVFTALSSGLLACGLPTGGLQAQDALGDSVLGRPRPDYDPIGIDLFASPTDPGSPFVLYPSLEVSGGWDDNVFREESGPDSDFFLLLSPEVTLESDWDNHGLSLGARADIARYEQFGQNNVTAFEVDGQGFLDVGLDTRVFGGGSYGRFVDGRDDVDNAGSNDLVAHWDNTQLVGLETAFGDFQFSLLGERHRSNYVNNGANQQDRDRTQYDVSSRLGYEFQPGVVLFVEGGYNWRLYDEPTDDFGYERNSQGWEVAGGFSYDVTGVLFAEIGAGYRQQNYEDPRFGNDSGFAINGDIIWNPTDLLTVRGAAGTMINETTLEGASGARQIYGGIGFDYELAENLLFTSDAVYSTVNYEPAPGFSDRRDRIWQASAGLIFLVNEFFQLRTDYTFTTRNSSAAGQDFNDNTILLTLRTQL